MKRIGLPAVLALACVQGVFLLAGCGGSSGGGCGSGSCVTLAQPSISSFTAGASTIEATTGTTLTADFSNGTGVITPGNISVTSGTAVNVTPASTTAYTLTVTGASGTTPATQSTTVTVDPVPTITSFTASSSSVTSGGTIQFTASFAGGTGAITGPGIASPLAVTSGTAVTVTAPTVSTSTPEAYTLTVTPPVGTVTATQSLSVTVNLAATAAISSFTANPTTIESGSTTNLIGVFSGGTGAITGPGIASSLAVTSGASTQITPPAVTTQTTDTYTLTVTPTGGGTAVTQTVSVVVDPAPSIASFSASPSTITAGASAQLTADFSGGTGVVMPGNITMTSGTAVTVTPTSTTTYTLTVTPTLGSAIMQTVTVAVNTSITVNQGTLGAAVSNQLMGMNLAMWYDDVSNASSILSAFAPQTGAGITAVRWPGGSNSDLYHWNGTATYPTIAAATNCNGQYSVPDDSFANFESDIVQPGNLDLAVTADYGSDPACTGPGQPSEAAGWAAAAVADGTPIHYMTIGNEEYGSWEYDLHTPAANQHNPSVYASEMVGSTGFYQSIKTAVENAGKSADTTLVGVVTDADGSANGWDATVLGNAAGSYDFVEYHFYPQLAGSENDTTLVQEAAQQFTTNINTLKSELQTAGAPANMPIYVGEVGSVNANPGVQSWSITQGLYAGQLLGEAMNDGIARLTWWIGFGNCNGDNGNMSTSLYGWQNFGAYNVFADGSGDTGGTNNSACNYGGPIGTMSPTAQAFNLFQNVAVTGENALTANVVGDTTDVRAYAATHSGGTALVLFNLNETTPQSVVVSLSGQTSSSNVTVTTYDKEMYDYTNVNCQSDPTCTYDSTHDYSTAQWVSPTTTTLTGAQTFPITLTLQPWSMNVVIVK
jgi:hypothetical protein